MIGLEEREHNGIEIVRLHYTADPAKRSEEWRAKARLAFASERDWRREMEIDWSIAAGLPVYAEDFVRSWHVAKEPLLALEGRPIHRGWDFGLQPACVWAQVDTMGRLNVLAEMVTWDGRGEIRQQGLTNFAPAVVLMSNEWFPGADFTDYADPAGWQRSQTDEKTCVAVLNENGIYPRPGPVTFEARKHAIVSRLSQAAHGRPALLIGSDCTMLIEGFEGAYKYEEIGDTGRYKEMVEKNAWSHIMNALEYVVGGLYTPKSAEDEDRPPRRRRRVDRITGY